MQHDTTLRISPVPSMLVAALLAVLTVAGTGCAGGGQARGDGPGMSSSHPAAASRRGGERARNRAEDAQNRRGNSDVLVELGQRYYERGEYEIAVEKLQSALEIDPSSASAHSVLAIVYETINVHDRASQHYQRSAQLAPRDGAIQNNFGNWLCSQRRYPEADRAFQAALADPFYRTPDAAMANAGTCALSSGRLDAADEYLQRALQLHPESAQALLAMAELAFRRNEFMRARAFLQRADAQGGLAPRALELAAQVEEQLGDPGSAAAYRARMSNADGG